MWDIIIPYTKDSGKTKLLQKVNLSYAEKVFQFSNEG
jgi:hypothetical protein